MKRTCKQCGGQFDLDYRGGRPRERCYTCQPAGMRIVSTGGSRRPVPRSDPAPEILETYQRFIRDMGAEDTTDGQLALALARKWAEGGHTGQGIAALSRELLRVMANVERGPSRSYEPRRGRRQRFRP